MFRSLSATWLPTLAVSLPLPMAAQGPLGWPSSVRTWDQFHCDTESRVGEFTKVAAGWDLTGVLRSDGRIFVNGQAVFLGTDVPAAPAGLRYVDVAVTTYCMGLLSDGSITMWGGASLSWTPPPAPALSNGLRYTNIAAAQTHGLAIRSDGLLVAWGQPAANTFGQQNVPPVVNQVGARKCAANGGFSLALLTDGSIVAWGNNSLGQCAVPPLPPGVIYVDVYAGVRHSVAIRSDGQAVAWGDNNFGQCNVPPLPPPLSYLMASAGRDFSNALRSDGVFVTWGDQSLHQGDVPVIPPDDRCVQLASGLTHSVARLSSGRVLAWGYNAWLQAPVPTLPTSPHPARWLSAVNGGNHVLALTSHRELIGWGRRDYGITEVPISLQGKSWLAIGCGYLHNVALATDRMLYAWGDNTAGQCNVPPLPPGVGYSKFVVGPGHTVAMRSDGVTVAFGDNSWGCSQLPIPPPGMRYIDADCNYGKTLLLRSDGAILDIGKPYSGNPPTPIAPPGLQFVEVASSDFRVGAALLSDGSVVHWGPPGLLASPLPVLPFGVCYVEMDGNSGSVVLRRSDGNVDVLGHNLPAPPLDPGTSYVQVAGSDRIFSARVGPTCTYVSFAQGCAGSLPSSRLIPRDTPHLAKTLEVTLFDLPLDIAFLVFGWQQLPSPVDLGFVGMPGCDLHVSLDAIVPLVGANTQAKWFLRIPNDPTWVGTRFYNQAVVLDPAAGNPFGAVVGDAAEAVIGYW
jgi:hypothetical protein